MFQIETEIETEKENQIKLAIVQFKQKPTLPNLCRYIE
jgi:hypothetical protein